MSVTCSFKRKYGKLKVKCDDGSTAWIDAWSGGNCLLVTTWGKGKHLQFFFSDMAHLKNCSKNRFFEDYVLEAKLSVDLPHAKEIAMEMAKHGATVTLFPSAKQFK